MAKASVDKGTGLLEWSSKIAPQSLLVKVVKEGWRFVWSLMLKELAPKSTKGNYVREASQFQLASGSLTSEPGRYHLYLGNACPWCHRVRIVLALQGLEALITYTLMGSDPTIARRGGWIFTKDNPDPFLGAADLWEVYDTLSPGYRGRCTAPLLIDMKEKRILSNESSDIVQALNSIRAQGTVDLLPPDLASECTALCSEVYKEINNKVYEAGFATNQSVYDETQKDLFDALDAMEERLTINRYLLGAAPTMADVYLFPTVIRLDSIYSGLFKCSKKSIRADYPHLLRWLKEFWQLGEIRKTIDLDAARYSYYTSLFPLSPGGIVPSGPAFKDLYLDEC